MRHRHTSKVTVRPARAVWVCCDVRTLREATLHIFRCSNCRQEDPFAAIHSYCPFCGARAEVDWESV